MEGLRAITLFKHHNRKPLSALSPHHPLLLLFCNTKPPLLLQHLHKDLPLLLHHLTGLALLSCVSVLKGLTFFPWSMMGIHSETDLCGQQVCGQVRNGTLSSSAPSLQGNAKISGVIRNLSPSSRGTEISHCQLRPPQPWHLVLLTGWNRTGTRGAAMSHTAPGTLFQNTKWKQAREKFLLELFLLLHLEDHSLLCKWRKTVWLQKLGFFCWPAVSQSWVCAVQSLGLILIERAYLFLLSVCTSTYCRNFNRIPS